MSCHIKNTKINCKIIFLKLIGKYLCRPSNRKKILPPPQKKRFLIELINSNVARFPLE